MAESRALSSSSSRLIISISVSVRLAVVDWIVLRWSLFLERTPIVHGCFPRWQPPPWSPSFELPSAAHSTSRSGSTYLSVPPARSCNPCQLDLTSSVLLSTPGQLIGHSRIWCSYWLPLSSIFRFRVASIPRSLPDCFRPFWFRVSSYSLQLAQLITLKLLFRVLAVIHRFPQFATLELLSHSRLLNPIASIPDKPPNL
jgi:hypothetical protein